MKRLFVCMLAAVLLISAVPASSAAFSDITDSELARQVELMESLGIFAGMPDGTFHPNDMLNRASFCVLAVKLTAPDTDTSNYTGFTYFPDVRATHWGLGWVNASRSLGLISGYPDGSFGPSDPITFGQAVTVLMRALGYTDEQVGPNWPMSYINKAASIGVTKGLNHSPNDSVSRADAARMIYNLLYLPKYDAKGAGENFITGLGVTEKKDVIILSVTATKEDGVTPAILTSAGAFTYKTAISSSLLGVKGDLLLDKDENIINFASSGQTMATAIISEVTNINFKNIGGKVFPVGEKIPVYSPAKAGSDEWAGEKSPAWASILPGETVSVCYSASGAIEYVYRHSAPGTTGVIAVLSDPLTSANPLVKAFGSGAGNAVIYKNGVRCDVSDLCRWDVLSYDASANTVLVSDVKLTGAYQGGFPNNSTPTIIEALEEVFFLTPSASAKMAEYKVGTQYTYLFASNGYIADVLPTSTLRSDTVFLASQADVSGISEIMTGGYVLAITGKSSTPDYSGQLVTFSHTSSGTIFTNLIQYTPAKADLDLSARTLGDAKLSPYCEFYETAVKNGILTEITSTDILPKKIAREKIIHAGKDATGKITHIVFTNIVYDSYVFGPVKYGTEDQSGHSGSSKVNVIAVGKTAFMYNTESLPAEGSIVGLSGVRNATYSTYLNNYVECNKYTGINRYSFNTDGTVTVGSKRIPVADGVQVYIKATGESKSVEDALVYTNSFEIYTDPGDYRVRYIIAP